MNKVTPFGLSVLALLLMPLRAQAQFWPLPCNPIAVTPDGPPSPKSANTVYLKFLDSTFPEHFVSPYKLNDVTLNLRNLMREALAEAALQWNRRCGPLPILNDQPFLVLTSSDSEATLDTRGSFLVEVAFEDGFAAPAENCGEPFDGQLCHTTVARTVIFPSHARLVIFGNSGRVTHPDWTLFAFRGVYHRLFLYELEHMLLPELENCSKLTDHEPIPNRFKCAPADVDCEMAARSKHFQSSANALESIPAKVIVRDPRHLLTQNQTRSPLSIPIRLLETPYDQWSADNQNRAAREHIERFASIVKSVRDHGDGRCFPGKGFPEESLVPKPGERRSSIFQVTGNEKNILIGEVVAHEPAWDPLTLQIYTLVHLKVQRVVRGLDPIEVGDVVTYRRPWGAVTIGGVTLCSYANGLSPYWTGADSEAPELRPRFLILGRLIPSNGLFIDTSDFEAFQIIAGMAHYPAGITYYYRNPPENLEELISTKWPGSEILEP